MCCRLVGALAIVAILSAGCGRQDTAAEERERMRAARADSLAAAEELFDPSVFDTLTWNPIAPVERGHIVWRSSCEKCHGITGEGGGEYAVLYQIQVPSFLASDWQYAGDLSALRHRIFVGHEGEMPNWGLHGLKYRDIDAVVHYIEEVLRPREPLGN